ncbi:dimethylsulfonioproprionate lyase family protein [uncultured Roseovarius sp.]|uniref:dimethylsulfonioproprionate lyase family protein n=1 Tax=uncultured Roseovarius sp. TaxID=293344 RepID=UPI0026164FD4|nr:dimethylsulfonioproprionate lyase family protein [uncultured Roseovarius sp.]
MTRAVWDTLLDQVRAMHRAHPRLTAFCPFPDDITAQPVTPYHIPSADLFADETDLSGSPFGPLCDAIRAGGPDAHWRETYKGTDIGDDFMDRFGCYCIIGDGGPFQSRTMRAWMVYMPPHLHYRWHHHPAEEMYLVLAGSARFFCQGAAPEVLSAGQTSEHASNQPHAMETEGSSVLNYVIWRNGFDTPPVLTPEDMPS